SDRDWSSDVCSSDLVGFCTASVQVFAQSAKRKTMGRDIFPQSIMQRTIDISEAIDQSKIGAFQTGIFILCALCLIMDGFDVQARSEERRVGKECRSR